MKDWRIKPAADEMVERVAKAIHAVSDEPEHSGGWDGLSEEWRENMCRHARAAIAAMRDPTYHMRRVVSFEEAELIWPRMIAAALSE